MKQSPEETLVIMNRVDLDKAFVFSINEVNSRVHSLAKMRAYEKYFRSPSLKERKHS